MFVFLVQLHWAGAYLVATTESKCFYLEYFEWGFWKIYCQVFESVVSNLWLIGCCIIFHIHWQNIILLDFSLLLLGWHFYCSHTSQICICSFWNIWMGVFLSVLNLSFLSIWLCQPLFHLYYHELWLLFIQKIVLIYLFLFFFYKFFLN